MGDLHDTNDTVPFIPNTPPPDDFEYRKTGGGGFNAWGEKISFFLRFVIFCCNRQIFGPNSGGGGFITLYSESQILA